MAYNPVNPRGLQPQPNVFGKRNRFDDLENRLRKEEEAKQQREQVQRNQIAQDNAQLLGPGVGTSSTIPTRRESNSLSPTIGPIDSSSITDGTAFNPDGGLPDSSFYYDPNTSAGVNDSYFSEDPGEGPGNSFAQDVDWANLAVSFGGDALALTNYLLNNKDIDNMPIKQNYKFTNPVFEDDNRRDYAAINEIRRQARIGRLGTASGSSQREGNIAAIVNAGAVNEINKVRAGEEIRRDSVRARNAQSATRGDIINTGILNTMKGNEQQNQFTQLIARQDNRGALTDSLLGNQFQRSNVKLEEEKMMLTAMRDNDRGTLRAIYAEMKTNPKADPRLLRMLENFLSKE